MEAKNFNGTTKVSAQPTQTSKQKIFLYYILFYNLHSTFLFVLKVLCQVWKLVWLAFDSPINAHLKIYYCKLSIKEQ